MTEMTEMTVDRKYPLYAHARAIRSNPEKRQFRHFEHLGTRANGRGARSLPQRTVNDAVGEGVQ